MPNPNNTTNEDNNTDNSNDNNSNTGPINPHSGEDRDPTPANYNKQIVKASDGHLYYIIQKVIIRTGESINVKRIVPDNDTALALGFKLENIISVDDTTIDFYEVGNDIAHLKEGLLVKNTTSQLFLIQNGLRSIPDTESLQSNKALKKLNLNANDAVLIPAEDLVLIKRVPGFIPSIGKFVIQGDIINHKYFFINGERKIIEGKDELYYFQYKYGTRIFSQQDVESIEVTGHAETEINYIDGKAVKTKTDYSFVLQKQVIVNKVTCVKLDHSGFSNDEIELYASIDSNTTNIYNGVFSDNGQSIQMTKPIDFISDIELQIKLTNDTDTGILDFEISRNVKADYNKIDNDIDIDTLSQSRTLVFTKHTHNSFGSEWHVEYHVDITVLVNPNITAVEPTKAFRKIKHFFVLMLENRSYDHMLGRINNGADNLITPGKKIDDPKNPGKKIEDPLVNSIDVFVELHKTDPSTFNPNMTDPRHELYDTLEQLTNYDFSIGADLNDGPIEDLDRLNKKYADNGNKLFGDDKRIKKNDDKNDTNSSRIFKNSGFINNYGKYLSKDLTEVAKSFSEFSVPFIADLAKNFTVCDRWFASLPGPTWPNRFFMAAGTTGGYCSSPQKINGLPFGLDETEALYDTLFAPFSFKNKTIFDQLSKQGISWAVYHDGPPLLWAVEGMKDNALDKAPWYMDLTYEAIDKILGGTKQGLELLVQVENIFSTSNIPLEERMKMIHKLIQIFPEFLLLYPYYYRDTFRDYHTAKYYNSSVMNDNGRSFENDLKNGNVPSFVFIEPRYQNIPIDDKGEEGKNSQHPPEDPAHADLLILRTYLALKNSPIWDKSALIITYDEHGGFYDHVSPLVDYDKFNTSDDQSNVHRNWYEIEKNFQFDMTGVRVPAIIVSPYVGKGVDSNVYDHTSIIATLKKRFNLENNFSNRVAKANTFEHIFKKENFETQKDYKPNIKLEDYANLKSIEEDPNNPIDGWANMHFCNNVDMQKRLAYDKLDKNKIIEVLKGIKTVDELKNYLHDMEKQIKNEVFNSIKIIKTVGQVSELMNNTREAVMLQKNKNNDVATK